MEWGQTNKMTSMLQGNKRGSGAVFTLMAPVFFQILTRRHRYLFVTRRTAPPKLLPELNLT
jgi:hypothetical protein